MSTSPDPMPLVYTAQSKRAYYCRDAVCEYALRHGAAALNPFRVYGYFLGERIERETVRRGNLALIHHSAEVWVFGRELADGVLAEIALAHRLGKPVRFFTIGALAEEIREIAGDEVTFEEELLAGPLDHGQLLEVVSGARPFVRDVDPFVVAGDE